MALAPGPPRRTRSTAIFARRQAVDGGKNFCALFFRLKKVSRSQRSWSETRVAEKITETDIIKVIKKCGFKAEVIKDTEKADPQP